MRSTHKPGTSLVTRAGIAFGRLEAAEGSRRERDLVATG
jgi:hypothetical protein